MAVSYMQDEKLAAIAEKVIEENAIFHHLKDERCRIAYQYSDEQKKNSGKIVYADTEKIKDKLKGFLPYDFIITFYKPNTEPLSEDKMEKLMNHELRHVGFDPASGKHTIIPHDVEDFRPIINAWGIDWIAQG